MDTNNTQHFAGVRVFSVVAHVIGVGCGSGKPDFLRTSDSIARRANGLVIFNLGYLLFPPPHLVQGSYGKVWNFQTWKILESNVQV